MSEPAVLTTRDDAGVVTLGLNNPRGRNVLSSAMMTALGEALAGIARDREARVVVINAEGPGFCAGHDLREIRAHRSDDDGGSAFNERLFAQCAAMMQAIRSLGQPVIASVHAPAVAAGCELVATCDIAIASSEARFGVNGIDVGLFCSTPAVALARNVTAKRAFELLATGRLIDAGEALEIGLVNRVVAPGELAAATGEIAAAIAAKPAGPMALGKRTFYSQIALPLDDAYARAGAAMVDNLRLDDAAEGIEAFTDKRAPRWRRQ